LGHAVTGMKIDAALRANCFRTLAYEPAPSRRL